MNTFLDDIKAMGEARMVLARDVLAAAQELHDEGSLSSDALRAILDNINLGYVYQAKDLLEREYACHLLEQECETDPLMVLPDRPSRVLHCIMNGSSTH